MIKLTRGDLNQTVWASFDELEKQRKWYVIDAKNQTLGKVAEKAARILMGKDKVWNWDAQDVGDFVVILNAQKIKVTGNKLKNKLYFRYSGYKGNVKSATLEEMLQKKPEEVLKLAIKGMLPKNKLRKHRLKRAKIFAGEQHSFEHLNLQPVQLDGN